MDNEEKEAIVDPINEEGVEKTLGEIQQEETTKAEEELKEKSFETPEAKKARLERQLEQLGKKHPNLFVEKETTRPSKKSDEFGYDVKAYLKTSGIQTSEFDFVREEFKSSGLKDLDQLLENPYFKSRLESRRELSKTSEAIPTGKRSGGVPTDSVEYWASKPIEEVPVEMRIKVVNYQLAKEKNKGQFYNS